MIIFDNTSKTKKMTKDDICLRFKISGISNPDFCTIGNVNAQNSAIMPLLNAPGGNLKGALGNIKEHLVTLEGH